MTTAPITSAGPIIRAPNLATNEHYIVVEDWDGEYWEGSVIQAAHTSALRARGVKLLPYQPELAHVGNGGFFKRSWGAGYPLDFRVPRMCAPITVFCTKAYKHFEWCARIMPRDELIEAVKAGELTLEGMLRLASDTGSPTSYQATLGSKENPVLIKQLGNLDALDGWVIGGSAEINIQQDGHYSFALYGMAPGVRAVWVAATAALKP